jgi:hypothetical protein
VRLHALAAAELERGERDLAGERLLRQGRAVVRQVRLVADDDHLAGEPVGAQALSGPQAAQGRPRDDDPLRAHAVSPRR